MWPRNLTFVNFASTATKKVKELNHLGAKIAKQTSLCKIRQPDFKDEKYWLLGHRKDLKFLTHYRLQ